MSTPEPAGQTDTYDEVFSALAHPARRRILINLNFAGGRMGAGDIAALFGHAWPTTTRHLQIMEAARLIRHERQGRTRIYHLDSRRLSLARDWLCWFERDPVTARETHADDHFERDAAAVPAEHRSRRS